LFYTNALYFVVSVVLVVALHVVALVARRGYRIAKCWSSDSSVSEDSDLLGSWALSTEIPSLTHRRNWDTSKCR